MKTSWDILFAVIVVVALVVPAQGQPGGYSYGYDGSGSSGQDKLWRASDPTLFGMATMKDVANEHEQKMAALDSYQKIAEAGETASLYAWAQREGAKNHKLETAQKMDGLYAENAQLRKALDSSLSENKQLVERVNKLEEEKKSLQQRVAELEKTVEEILKRISPPGVTK